MVIGGYKWILYYRLLVVILIMVIVGFSIIGH